MHLKQNKLVHTKCIDLFEYVVNQNNCGFMCPLYETLYLWTVPESPQHNEGKRKNNSVSVTFKILNLSSLLLWINKLVI